YCNNNVIKCGYCNFPKIFRPHYTRCGIFHFFPNKGKIDIGFENNNIRSASMSSAKLIISIFPLFVLFVQKKKITKQKIKKKKTDHPSICVTTSKIISIFPLFVLFAKKKKTK
ncbi:hypothetical protein C2G38_2070317, partial [Gigaspora rosea]